MPTVAVSIPEDKLEQVFAVAFAPVVALSELIKNASDSCYVKNDIIKVYIEEDKQRIRIVDNGYGFSADDIAKLGKVTASSKMSLDNKRSRIGEFYAGSKGQGVFTAFNLCKHLEIKTFSLEDGLSYCIKWENGSAQIAYEEINEKITGTELILNGVKAETFKMITRRDELEKLISSTILYYEDSETLPTVDVFLNGNLFKSEITKKIENIYQDNRKRKTGSSGFFVAKAMFEYCDDKLKLSYEDNDVGLFNFDGVSLNVADGKELKKFAVDKGISLHKSSDIYEGLESFSDVRVDPFAGVLYLWINKTVPELKYEYGVRVYVNNYGLYNFLNKDQDWLGLSQISQNRKATSYKVKNTYGYVHFNGFDEGSSELKISSDRNSFMGALASKKFEFLMQNVIVNIFSSIDIEARRRKQNPATVFEEQANVHSIYVDEPFTFRKLIKVSSNISLSDIEVQTEGPHVHVDASSGEITVREVGNHRIVFTYGESKIDKNFSVCRRMPAFELRKKTKNIVYGASFDLRDLIIKSSLKNLSPDEVFISSGDAIIQGGASLSPANNPGQYRVEFKAHKYGVDVVRFADICVETANSKESDKLKRRFRVSEKYPKINDIIKGISETYMHNPTFASIGIRPLVEISLKAFASEFYSDADVEKMNQERSNFNPEAKIDSILNRLKAGSVDVDPRVASTYGASLQSSRKKVINAYKGIEPNDNIHGLQSSATTKQVFDTMSVISVLINFIIEAINAKHAKG